MSHILTLGFQALCNSWESLMNNQRRSRFAAGPEKTYSKCHQHFVHGKICNYVSRTCTVILKFPLLNSHSLKFYSFVDNWLHQWISQNARPSCQTCERPINQSLSAAALCLTASRVYWSIQFLGNKAEASFIKNMVCIQQWNFHLTKSLWVIFLKFCLFPDSSGAVCAALTALPLPAHHQFSFSPTENDQLKERTSLP